MIEYRFSFMRIRTNVKGQSLNNRGDMMRRERLCLRQFQHFMNETNPKIGDALLWV